MKDPNGIHIPDGIAASQLEEISVSEGPKNLDEALTVSSAEASSIKLAQQIVNSTINLVDKDDIEVYYRGQNGNNGIGYDEDGTPYEREFTDIYRFKANSTLQIDESLKILLRGKVDYTYEEKKSTPAAPAEK